jgi:hypothetical protein
MLASDDPERIKLGVTALFQFEPAELDFAKEALAGIVVSDRLQVYAPEPGNLLELLKRIRGLYPEAERAEARSVLAQGGDRTDTELLALLSVAAHGGDDDIAKTAAIVLAMPEEKFQQTVVAMSFKFDIVTGDIGETIWSKADVAEIARRAAAVPSAHLRPYIDSIRFAPGFADVKLDLKKLLDRRLAALTSAAGGEDRNLARTLQRLRDEL